MPVELTAGTHTLRLTFSGDGQNVNWLEFAAGSAPPAPTPTPTPEPADLYHFVLKWGNRGDGDGQFYAPYGIAADDPGNVYVVDTENYRVQKFRIRTESSSRNGGLTALETDSSIVSQVSRYHGAGNVYVVDRLNYRVQKFSSDGEFVTKWGTEGTGDGRLLFNPIGIAVDGAGNIYVTDTTLHRVQKFSWAGTSSRNGELIVRATDSSAAPVRPVSRCTAMGTST